MRYRTYCGDFLDGSETQLIVVDVRMALDSHVAQMMYLMISTVGARHVAEISFDASNKEQRVGLWLSQFA